MSNKILKSLILIFMVFLMTGCWDYISLSEMSIVTGMSIDKDEKTNQYITSFEIVSLSDSSKSKTVITKIIESKGSTIFEAVINCKKRLMDKLYFANMQIAIISNSIAKREGLKSVIDWFLRDEEVRETLDLAISQEKSAKEILDKDGTDSPIVSYQIKQIIREDSSVTASTKDVELYRILNIFKNDSSSLALPAVHVIKNNGKNTIEVNGIAAFKKDKLIGYLNTTESKYYSFIDNNVSGGILPLKLGNKDTDNVSLEIAESKTSKSYTYKNNKVTVTINTHTKVYLAEYENQTKLVDEKKLKNIQKAAEKMIEKNIKKVIQKAKSEFNTDIFSFGSIIYQNNSKLWKKIKGDWDDSFQNMDVIVKPSVVIVNTANLK